MSTLTNDGIEALLERLGVEDPRRASSLEDALTSPISIYMPFLADVVVQVTGCAPEAAYDSLQWPNELGDLVVVLPRLRIQHVKPHELAAGIREKVGSFWLGFS
jgi:arginyl-tRNA synthetase